QRRRASRRVARRLARQPLAGHRDRLGDGRAVPALVAARDDRRRSAAARRMSRPAVLVTGGARRIGAAIAHRFGEAGWHVVIHCCRSFAEAKELAAELPSAEVVRCDLADGDAARLLVEELAGRLTDWRALVASASVFRHDGAEALDVGIHWEAMQ